MLTKYGGDLDDPDVVREYFKLLLSSTSTDGARIQPLRKSCNYPEVAERFKMIEDDTESVVITQYGISDERETVRRNLDLLKGDEGPRRLLMRRLQPYIVNVRKSELPGLMERGLVSQVIDGVWKWSGSYDQVRGIGGAVGISPDTLYT